MVSDDWDLLLGQIEEGKVVPVVGRDLLAISGPHPDCLCPTMRQTYLAETNTEAQQNYETCHLSRLPNKPLSSP